NGHDDRVFHLQFSADGSRLLTVGEDGVAIQWSVATGDELKRCLLPDTGREGFMLSASRSGDRIAVCPLDRIHGELALYVKNIYVYDIGESSRVFGGAALGDGVELHMTPGKNRRYPYISRDGRYLVEAISSAAEGNSAVIVWDVETGKLHRHLGVRGEL